jgi:hypothetical protein
MKKIEVQAPPALPKELKITEIEMSDEIFTLTAHCMRKHPCVPFLARQHTGSIALTSAKLQTSHLVESACACEFWCVNAFVMLRPVSAKSLLSV